MLLPVPYVAGKSRKIGVLNSERTDRDSATVLLEFTNASGSPSEYTGGLLLRMRDGEWKVLSNAVDARK